MVGYGTSCLIISALRRLKQEDCEFETSLGYIVRLSLNSSLLSSR
jgi:hypothetical protein